MSRCYDCWYRTTNPFGTSVHISNPANVPPALWTPIALENGKWAFQADDGRYLNRCNGCVLDSRFLDFAFAFAP